MKCLHRTERLDVNWRGPSMQQCRVYFILVCRNLTKSLCIHRSRRSAGQIFGFSLNFFVIQIHNLHIFCMNRGSCGGCLWTIITKLSRNSFDFWSTLRDTNSGIAIKEYYIHPWINNPAPVWTSIFKIHLRLIFSSSIYWR